MGRLTARSSGTVTEVASAIAVAHSASVAVSRGYAKGWCRTSGTYSTPTHVGFGRDQHDPVGRLVKAADPHLLVEHRALLGVGQVQPGSQAPKLLQQRPHQARVDLLLLAGAGGAELVEGVLGVALLLDGLGDPLVDDLGVAAGLQRRPMAGELALTVGQGQLGGPQPRIGAIPGLGVGGGQPTAGRLDVGRADQPGEPRVQLWEQVGLAEVDVDRMGKAGAVGVFGGVAAAVVGLPSDLLAL
jgi:hypothetical protein